MSLCCFDRHSLLLLKKLLHYPCNKVMVSPLSDKKQIIIMEQQNTGKKSLDSIERAKLGVRVFNLPFDEAEEVIDAYVSDGDYDPDSVELFKVQLDTQRHIQEKSVELLSTGAEIVRLVVNAFVKNMPQPANRNSYES